MSSIDSSLTDLSEEFKEVIAEFEKWREYYLEEFDAYSICRLLITGISYDEFPIETRKRYDFLSKVYDFDSFINDFC